MLLKKISFLTFAVILFTIQMMTQPAFAETKDLRIIATSDLHGKFFPYNYIWNAEDPSGSVTQLATLISQYRTPDTLLIDVGDTMQNNFAEIFVNDKDIHPMILALNALKYDIWVTGNHDYDYGLDILKKSMSDIQAKVLVGNVYDQNGKPIADGYVIKDIGGVRIAVIGMLTPNAAKLDNHSEELEKCMITNPLEETQKIIKKIQGKYDVLIGAYHMGIHNEYGVVNSSVADILEACPEFDVMISSHEHTLIPSKDINGVLVVQNKGWAKTVSIINIKMEKTKTGWKIAEKNAGSLDVGKYKPDLKFTKLLTPYHKRARAYIEK